MRVHIDHRRSAYCDVFPDAGLPGDINVFRFEPHARTFWHRHQKQTDRFLCLEGWIDIVTLEDGMKTGHFLNKMESVTILPNTWHGYYTGPEGALVLMYLDQKFDPTDEEKMDE